MPTRKIAALPEQQPCQDPEHGPNMFRAYEPGLWEHECPTCHEVVHFRVDQPVIQGREVGKPDRRQATQRQADRTAEVLNESEAARDLRMYREKMAARCRNCASTRNMHPSTCKFPEFE